ncbi:hypothetical protein PP180_09540 [Muricauda sp. SK9]|nr:hypothetical protein [Muricauda sp. SK9]
MPSRRPVSGLGSSLELIKILVVEERNKGIPPQSRSRSENPTLQKKLENT